MHLLNPTLSILLTLLSTTTAATTTTASPSLASPTPSPSPPPSPNSPPPSSIHIPSIAFAGSGCPAGSLSASPSLTSTSIALTYTNMTALTRLNSTAAQARKNCQINIRVRHPPNWFFSVRRTTYRGHARIPVGVNGTARAGYYFSGGTAMAQSTMAIPGPFDGEFTKVDVFSEDNVAWSPCGSEAMININAEVRLTPVNSTQPAVLSVTSLEDVELGWRWCGPKETTSSASAAASATAAL
ncbi:hypothetical protein QBC34DRAFT_459510 [Podospora aff. communis PSN243]|uniref:Uncharacterized protein n=1 Tax=Podospora aff. communis PSN243 TaxID=3040156 RepID=A0AAV9GQW1_9PEZI|nr:hypothetical protein QBC34DRAFT_459510 [Podospora aff. communis PSN243]